MASLPVALTIGYDTVALGATAAIAEPLSPRASLQKLIFLVGPWGLSEKEQAEDFARRFLKSKQAAGRYLPESSALVQSLARRFPDGTMAMGTVDLKDLPQEERALFVDLTKQIYSLIEVRFLVSKEPAWGECQGNALWQTRIPR